MGRLVSRQIEFYQPERKFLSTWISRQWVSLRPGEARHKTFLVFFVLSRENEHVKKQTVEKINMD